MTTHSHLAANWSDIRRRVDEACRAAGRDPAEVSILPVSKTFGPELIREGVALGMRRFGENKVQEIRDKAPLLVDCGIAWVMIGHLQTNKAKDVARLASEVQSLDRLELADLAAELRSFASVADRQFERALERTRHCNRAQQRAAFAQRRGINAAGGRRDKLRRDRGISEYDAVARFGREIASGRDIALRSVDARHEVAIGTGGEYHDMARDARERHALQ